MDITEIKIYKATDREPVVGYANIVLGGNFIVRGITLLERQDGTRFISMPSRKIKSEEKVYRDICHPLNSRARQEFTDRIFGAYDEFINRAK